MSSCMTRKCRAAASSDYDQVTIAPYRFNETLLIGCCWWSSSWYVFSYEFLDLTSSPHWKCPGLLRILLIRCRTILIKKGTAIRCIGLLHMTYKNYDPDRHNLEKLGAKHTTEIYFSETQRGGYAIPSCSLPNSWSVWSCRHFVVAIISRWRPYRLYEYDWLTYHPT